MWNSPDQHRLIDSLEHRPLGRHHLRAIDVEADHIAQFAAGLHRFAVCQAKRGPRYIWFESYFFRMPITVRKYRRANSRLNTRRSSRSASPSLPAGWNGLSSSACHESRFVPQAAFSFATSPYWSEILNEGALCGRIRCEPQRPQRQAVARPVVRHGAPRHLVVDEVAQTPRIVAVFQRRLPDAALQRRAISAGSNGSAMRFQ